MFNFSFLKKLFYIFFILNLHLLSFSGNNDKDKVAEKVIIGKITDSYGQSIVGAKILIQETGETFYSDLDGNYKLALKSNEIYSISIGSLGYSPLKIKSNNLFSFSDLTLQSIF